tara:strand:- start:14352 stop:14561 length:210 start_codon:yes stop_codon:yes gene_type:complete
MKLIINSEADIERAVKDIVDISSLPDEKKVSLDFSSFMMSVVFDDLLLETFNKNGIDNVNIDVRRIVRS